MEILLKSFSNKDVTYTVNKLTKHCSCPSYSVDGGCKHLEAVGVFNKRRANLSSRPSYSQALSGLVKGIRVRNLFEAAYWLNYCWQFRTKLSGSQFRTVRRLLIGSAEDGHSIAVMEKMADSFVPLLANDASLEDVVLELIRICKVPNWWHPASGGPDYIYSGMVGDRKALYDDSAKSTADCLDRLQSSIDQGDKISALSWVLKADRLDASAGKPVAERLLKIALQRDHAQATRMLRNVYFRHAKSLAGDSNFTCQAAWLLAGGASQVIDQIEHVEREEARSLLDEVLATPNRVIPEWCCDGIHCAGNDVRYSGMWDRMYAVCCQYKHYQRLNPDDPWLEDDFYSMDGLKTEDVDA